MSRVAVFRPDDGRLADAVEYLTARGVDAVSDAMLEVVPTGASPRQDAAFAILTSKTGVELAADAGWTPHDATVCAVGDATADALRDAGYAVDVVPREFSSTGLVAALETAVDGARVEVARSDHGSQVLLDGLNDAGAFVHETVLYRLVRPARSGTSADVAARGELDAALFTSSLTVAHFLAAADERDVRADAITGLNGAVVGCIGEPTRETAEAHGIDVDVVPETAAFDALADAVLARLG